MTHRNTTCPKCPGTMEAGFIPDSTYGGNVLMQWFAGVPGKGFFGGLKLDAEGASPDLHGSLRVLRLPGVLRAGLVRRGPGLRAGCAGSICAAVIGGIGAPATQCPDENWCRMRGLNPRPSVYKTAALPLS
jgi:hypothetical protein